MAMPELTVLAIDDQPDNLLSLRALLLEEFPSAQVLTASSGSRGLELAAAHDPDVVLLDVLMPGMDGFEVCSQLKANLQTRDVPVVFVTALQTERAHRLRALEVGAEAFLSKPIDPAELVAQIRAMLKIKAAALYKRNEARELGKLVAARTQELEQSRFEALRLLEQLRAENEARRRSETALKESEHKFSMLFHASPAWIAITSLADGRFIDANQAFCEGLGYRREELVGHTTLELGLYSKSQRTQVIKGALTQPQPHEVEMRTRSGERRQLLIGSERVVLGSETCLLAAGVDLTERNRAETERLQLTEQLRISQKLEAIGSLAGGVAHDFNNLLSVILNYAEFALEKTVEGDSLREDLLEVRKAGERATALTRQLLAFSRKQMLRPVSLNLNSVVRSTERMLRRILGEDIQVILNLAPDLDVVCADPSQFEQVLMNLVVNARDAMPKGGTLTIHTKNEHLTENRGAQQIDVEPGSYVSLTVTDTGCGIDPQVQAHIFEPFFTTKSQGKGTGLGLSTVYGIVKQSGGTVSVRSEPGLGAIFTVLLPLTTGAVANVQRPTSGSEQRRGTETILVVEDEAALRRVAQRCLENVGYTVLTAADGDEALTLAEQHADTIQLLLTDVVMPRMNGRELASELQRRRPTLKVLYMSGYTDDAIVHHGVLDQGTWFLGKPFTPTGITEKVREVLDAELPEPIPEL